MQRSDFIYELTTPPHFQLRLPSQSLDSARYSVTWLVLLDGETDNTKASPAEVATLCDSYSKTQKWKESKDKAPRFFRSNNLIQPCMKDIGKREMKETVTLLLFYTNHSHFGMRTIGAMYTCFHEGKLDR